MGEVAILSTIIFVYAYRVMYGCILCALGFVTTKLCSLINQLLCAGDVGGVRLVQTPHLLVFESITNF